MRGRFILFILFPLTSVSQKIQPFIQAGVNYRQYPIDLEDVIIYYPEQGGFYGTKFWQTWSFAGSVGIITNHHLQFSVEADVRHNLFHWVKGERRSYNSSGFRNENREFVRNFKYDLFLNAEKKFRLENKKENFLFVLAGIGYTNLNTGYDLIL